MHGWRSQQRFSGWTQCAITNSLLGQDKHLLPAKDGPNLISDRVCSSFVVPEPKCAAFEALIRVLDLHYLSKGYMRSHAPDF